MDSEKLFLKCRTAMQMFDVSRNTLDRIATEAGAVVYFGRMKRYDKEKLVTYFHDHAGRPVRDTDGGL